MNAALNAWLEVPSTIVAAIEGLDLDRRGGPDGWSIRETVHHLVESDIVAAGILIAALGKSGCTYDWTWLNPDGPWVNRMRYDAVPVGLALDALRALGRHLSAVIRAIPDAAGRTVNLIDAPGAAPHAETVEAVLKMQVDHAREHLRTLGLAPAERA